MDSKNKKIFKTGANESPKNCGFTWRKRKYIEIKDELNDKRTSIATVQGLYRIYASRPPLVLTHYRLPLMLYNSLVLFDVMPVYKKRAEPIVIKEFHPKKGLEKGLNSYLINLVYFSSYVFPPTPCFVHRVDARPTVFRDGDLEPHMKLEGQVNEVFFYQNMYFLHAKIIHRRRKIVVKTVNIY